MMIDLISLNIINNMSQMNFENDGYEYQPSEHSEKEQPTPTK